MSRAGSTIKSYIFWSYERGSMQYDVMVTLILAFIFLAPRFIDFHDRPAYVPNPSDMVTVRPDGNELVCEIDAKQLPSGPTIESRLTSAIEPVLGQVYLDHYEAQRNFRGKITGYRLWVYRK